MQFFLNHYWIKREKEGQKWGFTLMEVMIAIAIIGILTSAALGSFISSQIKGRDARRKADLQQLARALELMMLVRIRVLNQVKLEGVVQWLKFVNGEADRCKMPMV